MCSSLPGIRAPCHTREGMNIRTSHGNGYLLEQSCHTRRGFPLCQSPPHWKTYTLGPFWIGLWIEFGVNEPEKATLPGAPKMKGAWNENCRGCRRSLEKEQSQLNKGICVPKANAFRPAARAYKTGPDLSGEESGHKEQRSCARWILQQQLDTFLIGRVRNFQYFCGLVPERAECWGRSTLAVLQRLWGKSA